jgi:hypothetical protein
MPRFKPLTKKQRIEQANREKIAYLNNEFRKDCEKSGIPYIMVM